MSLTINSGKSGARFRKKLIAQTVAASLAAASFTSLAAEQSEPEEDIDDVIVVTAQKRVQNVMKVPVTVDSVSSDTIEESGSILLQDIDKFIPGFDFSEGTMTQAGVTIRGVSSPNISVGLDPSSATFFDDVYMPRAAQNVLFSDMQRIEVLKGPQGTLFGKNAAMGVVNMIPNAPQEDFEGFIKGTFGTDNLVRIEGMINFELMEDVYFRANFLTNEQDGFVENVARPEWNEGTKIWELGAENHDAARAAIKWQVSDSTDVTFSFDWDDLEQAPPMAIGLSPYAWENPNDGVPGNIDPFADKAENDVRNGVEGRDMTAYTLKINHEFDENWSMKLVTSYREWETVNRQDEDGTAQITRYLDTSNNEKSDIFYNELQFNYVGEKLSYVGGVTYSKEDVYQETEINVTTDTVARLVTGDLNGQVKQVVGGEVLNGLQQAGLIDMAMGDVDTAAAIYACSLQGLDPSNCIGQVTFNDVVDQAYADSGLEMDHLWNADEWANVLSAFGIDASPEFVMGTGDLTYDLASQMFGEPLIFGPSFAGMFWSENFINTGDFTSYGIYSDFDYQFTDKWNAFFGLRYTRDDKEFTWEITETEFAEERPGVRNILFPSVPMFGADESWNELTGRIGTGYQITDDHMVFASYATGYKAGGYDSLNISSATMPFEPEEVKNLEIGYKGVLADSLRTTLAFYHTILDGRQRSIESKPPGQNQALPTVVNEDLELNGIEVTLEWEIIDGMILGAVTDYRETDQESEAFYNAVGELIPAMTISGESSVNYTITYDWMMDIGLGDTRLHIDYVFAENTRVFEVGQPAFVENIPNYYDDRQDLNARLSWASENENWELAIWGKNLLDNRYVEGSLGGRTADVLGTPYVTINRGLEAGVEVKYGF
ncbi:TonB-dependent receptor [Thalassotalea sp. PS06]|uniref:TonB-dependent receptor n=1 Tax=Thalassotalea sp. PS06 TaxID=2594005 RepID=UPI001163D275|nr:TonB-dependent receptor [Thalassotalea sp. PS06]QDP00891.1 TonB-dependent receptor [Thalassotalea sp. PS06]